MSGAAHDSVYIARVAPTTVIFVAEPRRQACLHRAQISALAYKRCFHWIIRQWVAYRLHSAAESAFSTDFAGL
jgi:hypothetical protein